MKKIGLLTTLILIKICLQGRSYPVNQIYPKNCDTTTSDCSYPLPKIENADYQKYRYNRAYRKVYTMLQGATYFDGRDVGMGSHQGVDIASAAGTPILATHQGKVIIAEYREGRGRTITIEHQRNGQKTYSSYAHLQELLVTVGQEVTEGETIALMGSSGNSTGPHLHFQIETEGEHPFFFKNCVGTTSEIVNEGRCQSQMYQNTVDPILFIEKQGNIPLNNTTNEVVTETEIEGPQLQLSGFLGGRIVLGDTQEFIIQNNTDIPSIVEPIAISPQDEKISAYPLSIEVLSKERKIFLTAQETGFTQIHSNIFDHDVNIPIFIEAKENPLPNIPTIKINTSLTEKLIVIKKENLPNLDDTATITLLGTTKVQIGQHIRSLDQNLRSRFYDTENYIPITSIKNNSTHPNFLIFKIKKIDHTPQNIILFQGQKPIAEISIN